jgi:ABC-type uncharacterized transport system permease subunit
MSQTAVEEVREPLASPQEVEHERRTLGVAADVVVRSLLPLLLALAAGATVLAAIGVDPIKYYKDIYIGGIEYSAWQDSVMRMAPLLLMAVGLIVVFRAGIWNLGMDGQFLLAAAIVAGTAPKLEPHTANTLNLALMFVVAGAVGAAWTIVPALLKARYELNEIITTLMMTFIGINLAGILVKGPFQDFSSNVPQTSTLAFEAQLPTIPGTRIHVGVLVAALAALLVWYLMSRTSFGLRLQVLGASLRAARHMGLDVARLVIVSFLISGFFVGLAAAAEILGIWGYVRADWNPAFGLWVVPLVFLARLHAIGVIPFVFLLAMVSIGGDFAAQEANLSPKFTLLLVGLTLLFMSLTEWLGRKRELGGSYLPSPAARRRRGGAA